MSAVAGGTGTVHIAREYYDSKDADNFYLEIWGGEDIHVGLYGPQATDIRTASQRTIEELAKRVRGVNERSRVLDAGAGYGGSARWLAKRFGCRVTCLNLSEAQNERNRELTAAAGVSHLVDVRQGNFERMPFEDRQFDVVWSQDSLLHSAARETVLSEIDRVLKPGGEAIFTDPMQADDCPEGVLAPVLERIHLQDLGSFGFYRTVARRLGWTEGASADLSPQLIRHYRAVREELARGRLRLQGKVSDGYIERMIRGLSAWVRAGEHGHLAWGILHFCKPLRSGA